MSDRRRLLKAPALTMAIAAIVVLVAPPLLPPYWLSILTLAVIMSVLAIGLNLLMGYTGLDSLGQAAFFGTAAYFLGLATARYGMSWWLAALGGLLLATLFAALFGLVAVRLKGLYFLLITLAFAQVLWGVTLRWGTFTGGWNGLRGVPRPLEALQQPLPFYYAAAAVLAVVWGLANLVISSPFGLGLRGIREREVRSVSLGYDTRRHKYLVFVIAGFMGGIAGVMSAAYNGFVSPRDLSVELSFDAMLMVIVGGTGTLVGPVVGALIVTFLRYVLSVYVPNYWLIIVGLLFVAVTIWMPDGLMGLVRKLRTRSTSPPSAPDAGVDEIDVSPLQTVGPEAPSRDGASVLSLTDVSKRFGDVRVVDGVTLDLRAGERVGVIGLNGAGKTTLFNVISGVHEPSAGSIRLFDRDVTREPANVRNQLGLARTFQINTLYPSLTVHENIVIALLGRRFRKYQFSLFRPLSRLGDVNERAGAVLRDVGLASVASETVRLLSYGHQRQVEIALALASDPSILLLDEPTAGLSQAEMPAMIRLLKSLPADVSIMIVEHNLEVIFEVVDRVVVLHQGRLIRDGDPRAIREDAEIKELYFGTHVAGVGSAARDGGGGEPHAEGS